MDIQNRIRPKFDRIIRLRALRRMKRVTLNKY